MTDELRHKRNEALRSLDMDYFREAMPGASNDFVRLAAAHKARYECTDLEPEFRHASRNWLAEHDMTRFNGMPLLPEGTLP